jgi:acetylornithine deacetylase/succinyl-diaminopimelate desuccinylase-like protein
MPDYDAQIKRNLGLARTEGETASLQTQLMLPALNVRGIAGGAVGEAAANVISSEATASIDFRLVPNQTPDGVRRRVEQHVERQGYFIVRQPPDEATRLAHPKIALLSWDKEGSYPAARTPLDNPMAQHVARVVEQMAPRHRSSVYRSRTSTTTSTRPTRICACRICGTQSKSSPDCSQRAPTHESMHDCHRRSRIADCRQRLGARR